MSEMIEIFNGRNRKLGSGQKSDIHIKMSVGLRKHLHRFKGSSLTVFLCIALHADEHGWAFPSLDTIKRETGISHNAIYASLSHLRSMEIDGKRILVKYQKTENGKFSSNRYLIFPSAEEVEQFDSPSPQNRVTDSPSPTFRATVNRVTKKNHVKGEPFIRKDIPEEEPAKSSIRLTPDVISRADFSNDISRFLKRPLREDEERILVERAKDKFDAHKIKLAIRAYASSRYQRSTYGEAIDLTIICASKGKLDHLITMQLESMGRTTWNCSECLFRLELTHGNCVHCGHDWASGFHGSWSMVGAA